MQLVQLAARQRARPFNSVLELLPRSDEDDEDENALVLSPEEQLLRDLVNLALTIRDDGQVNPLTVATSRKAQPVCFGLKRVSGVTGRPGC